MLFSDTLSISLSCPMHIHKHTHIPCHFRETNLGTTLRIILFLPWCKTQYGVMETGPNEEKGGGELQALVGTDREWLADLASEASWDKSSRVALSIFICVFGCGEFSRLRGGRTAATGQKGRKGAPQTEWTGAMLRQSCVAVFKVIGNTSQCSLKIAALL